MQDPDWRVATCVHEAGHVYYARRAGAVDFRYHGPLEYPERPGDFGSAAVGPVFPKEGLKVDLLDIAKWYAAGGVVMRRLVPDFATEDCDANDLDVFKDDIRKRSPEISDATLQNYWVQAQSGIERDLRKPALRRELWALAREIEQKIPWGG